MRSPISTLVFAGDLLEKDVVQRDPVRLAKVAATVKSSARRLTWLVENLQRLARMRDAAADLPNQQLIDLGQLADEVARQLADMAASRNVTVKVGPNLPSLVADPARLELILLNLVANAIKYSDPEKVEPFVEVVPVDPQADAPNGVCTIAVRDNGLGIPDEDQPAIFDRFFRAHAHLDHELGVSGTGLGLAIVVDCVQAIGGTIRCESRVGEGTAFSITVPAIAPSTERVRCRPDGGAVPLRTHRAADHVSQGTAFRPNPRDAAARGRYNESALS